MKRRIIGSPGWSLIIIGWPFFMGMLLAIVSLIMKLCGSDSDQNR